MRGSAVRAVSCSSESVETVVASMRSGRLKRRPGALLHVAPIRERLRNERVDRYHRHRIVPVADLHAVNVDFADDPVRSFRRHLDPVAGPYHVLSRELDRCDEAQNRVLEHERHQRRRSSQSEQQVRRIAADQDRDDQDACDYPYDDLGRLYVAPDRFPARLGLRFVNVVDRIEQRSDHQRSHDRHVDAQHERDRSDQRGPVPAEDCSDQSQ